MSRINIKTHHILNSNIQHGRHAKMAATADQLAHAIKSGAAGLTS